MSQWPLWRSSLIKHALTDVEFGEFGGGGVCFFSLKVSETSRSLAETEQKS